MHLAWLLLRTGAVFGLLGVAIWCLRRSNGPKLKAAEAVELVGSKRLGRSASVAVVRIGERTYALGVTEKSVTLLTEAELAEPEPAPATPEQVNPTFAAALADSVRQLAGRRRVTPLELPAAPSPAPAPEPAPARRTTRATAAAKATAEKPSAQTAVIPTAKPAPKSTSKTATKTASAPARKTTRSTAAKTAAETPVPDATDGATTTARRTRAAAQPTSEEPSCPTPRRTRAAASARLAS